MVSLGLHFDNKCNFLVRIRMRSKSLASRQKVKLALLTIAIISILIMPVSVRQMSASKKQIQNFVHHTNTHKFPTSHTKTTLNNQTVPALI